MKEANLNSSAPEPGTTRLSAAHVEEMKHGDHYDKQEQQMQLIKEIKGEKILNSITRSNGKNA